MYDDLSHAIASSERFKVEFSINRLLEKGVPPLLVHDSLFSIVHCVQNPPFINPHLPKVYAINRELASYLESKAVTQLLRVEVEEFTWREKSEPFEQPAHIAGTEDFAGIEQAIADSDAERTARLMYGFLKGTGSREFVKNMLLLGSGYLNHSLGHSLSCTAFILIEMISRKKENPWPALTALARYFCNGNFFQKPALQYSAISDYTEVFLSDVRRAVTGFGITPLHHTLTVYAIERVRSLLEHHEYDHLLTMWVHMLGSKEDQLAPVQTFPSKPLPEFATFYLRFKNQEQHHLLGYTRSSLSSAQERRLLSRYLITSVLNNYNGRYNPHYFTGLGSSIWLLNTYYEHPDIVLNGLRQYFEFFFSGMSA